ncbi:MAG TPA: alpha/beta fold hydrolase [Candidatus Fermentibacter sp.]|nr:alpha/beta fold hydrolase [Candidatus Fermentibacter sp.]
MKTAPSSPCDPMRASVGLGDPDRKLVVLLHGLGAAKEVQAREMGWLADAGYTAVTIDAPHHGERRGPLLDEIDRERNPARRRSLIMDLVTQAAAEIPDLLRLFRGDGFARIAVAGISLGGHTTFGAILHDPRPDVLVPLIASPEWNRKPSPHEQVGRFATIPTLAIVSRLDTIVPPDPCRVLFHRLSAAFPDAVDRLRIVEYPESGHVMREEDWADAWRRIIAFLDRFL